MFSIDWNRLLIGIAIFGLLVASPASVTTVTAKAPPEPVCGVCTSALDEAAIDHGVTIDRGESTMNVQLYENGSARFSARVELTRGAERLRNDTLRETIVRDVPYILVEDRRQLETEMENNELIVRYQSGEVAHVTMGVLQFDAFQTWDPPPFASGGEGSPYPGAETLTLRAPPEFRLQGSHGDVSNDTAVVWHGDRDQQASGNIEEDVVISFVPKDAVFPNLRERVANLLDWAGSLANSVADTGQ